MNLQNIRCGTSYDTNYTLHDLEQFHDYLDGYLDQENLSLAKEIFARIRAEDPLFQQAGNGPIDQNKFCSWRSSVVGNLQNLELQNLKHLRKHYKKNNESSMLADLLRTSKIFKKVTEADSTLTDTRDDALEYAAESLCDGREWKAGIEVANKILDRSTRRETFEAVIHSLVKEKNFSKAKEVTDQLGETKKKKYIADIEAAEKTAAMSS